jgi:hypothetical protein
MSWSITPFGCKNAHIENGSLVIKALQESYTGPDGTRNYTSARLKTQNKFSLTYGRIEARVKVPYGQGIWLHFGCWEQTSTRWAGRRAVSLT